MGYVHNYFTPTTLTVLALHVIGNIKVEIKLAIQLSIHTIRKHLRKSVRYCPYKIQACLNNKNMFRDIP